jgi:hypothetical protein
MSRDVHCCTHWLRPRNPPPHPPALGLVCECAIGRQRQTTSLCNRLIKWKVGSSPFSPFSEKIGSNHCRFGGRKKLSIVVTPRGGRGVAAYHIGVTNVKKTITRILVYFRQNDSIYQLSYTTIQTTHTQQNNDEMNFQWTAFWFSKAFCYCEISAGILEQSMGARNRDGIGSLYRPARLHRLAEWIPSNRFLGSLKV